jgi:hypothetical protein
MQRLGVAVAFATIAVASLESTSEAQAGVGFRLSVDTTLLSLDSGTASVEGGSSSRESEVSLTTMTFGLGAPELGLSPAAVIGDEVVIGARVGVRSQSTETDDVDTRSTLEASFVPFFEYAFLPGNSVRPAIGAGIGVAYDDTESTSGSGGSSFTVGSDRIALLVTAFFRLHLFAADAFSITPGLFLRYSTGNRTQRGASGIIDTIEFSESHLVFGVGVDLAGWVGREPGDDAPVRSTEWATPVEAAPPTVAAPAPPPQPITTEMRTRLTMNGASLDVIADPTVAGGELTLQLAWLSRSDPPSCATLVLETATGARELPVQEFRRPQRGFMELSSVARVPFDALRALAASESAAVRLCDARWEVWPSSRRVLSQFLERYLVAAHARGNAPVAPVEPPPAPEPPSEAIVAPLP